MSRIDDVIRRYEACRGLTRQGVEIFAVGDPAGAQLNAVVRKTIYQAGDDGSEVWGDLLRAASALRWRRMTQPQPNRFNPALIEAVNAVFRESKLLRGSVEGESLLDQMGAAATAVRETDSPVGEELLRSVQEVGAELCVVVASKSYARAGLLGWLEQFGVLVVVPTELNSLGPDVEQSYVVGPPTFFPSALVTAPVTGAITFVMPSWFGNRSVPTSSLASHAAGGIVVSAKVYQIGDVTEPVSEEPVADIEDTYYPQPDWGRRTSEEREPGSDEVDAWKVLLGGGIAMWLDDGERIRSLDPRQPRGDRVGYEAVDDVQPGTYLVLREGSTEHRAMFDAALVAVGERRASIMATQKHWKEALADRLAREGAKRVVAELGRRNVRSAARVNAWPEPTLICPKREEDLAALLEWLGIPVQPSLTNALSLRRALYKASAELRQELEDAVGQTDLRALEREGFVRLELDREGFRGMIAARVLARSPFTEVVPRAQARVPFVEDGGQWLE